MSYIVNELEIYEFNFFENICGFKNERKGILVYFVMLNLKC